MSDETDARVSELEREVEDLRAEKSKLEYNIKELEKRLAQSRAAPGWRR